MQYSECCQLSVGWWKLKVIRWIIKVKGWFRET